MILVKREINWFWIANIKNISFQEWGYKPLSKGIFYYKTVVLYDCKNKLTLPFDFKINGYLRPICVEFDGYMHYKPRGTDNIEHFIQRKINDGIKNEYCLNKGIKLIRIPYWEFKNIENILIKELHLK